MGCKQLWYQHAFHVKQGYEDMWCVRVCLWVCARTCVCVVWHIFTEGCVLSLSFGVKPEAMSNWSLHTFRLDSHWHARPWLSSLCHEKGKQRHRNMPPCWLREKLCRYLLLFFVSLHSAFAFPLSASRDLAFHLERWTFQPWRHNLRDVQEGHNCLSAPCCSWTYT